MRIRRGRISQGRACDGVRIAGRRRAALAAGAPRYYIGAEKSYRIGQDSQKLPCETRARRIALARSLARLSLRRGRAERRPTAGARHQARRRARFRRQGREPQRAQSAAQGSRERRRDHARPQVAAPARAGCRRWWSPTSSSATATANSSRSPSTGRRRASRRASMSASRDIEAPDRRRRPAWARAC